MPDESTLALAHHYIAVDRPEAALEALDRVTGDALEDPSYWQIRGQALLDLERWDDAIGAARSGLERDPQDTTLLFLLGTAQLQLSQFDSADETLRRALAIDPDDAILHVQQAVGLARRRRFEEADDALVQAERLAPDDVQVLRARAQIAVMGEFWEAERYVDELLEHSPDDALGHALRGKMALGQGGYRPAARSFAEAARLDPTDRTFAEAARETRVAAHPVLVPVHWVLRFGRWRSYFLYLGLVVVLAAARLETLRIAVIVVWLTVCAISWFGPPLLRRRQRRWLGGF
jgi:Flp pilus assembly protein TadD